jgi:hypothetical protein
LLLLPDHQDVVKNIALLWAMLTATPLLAVAQLQAAD